VKRFDNIVLVLFIVAAPVAFLTIPDCRARPSHTSDKEAWQRVPGVPNTSPDWRHLQVENKRLGKRGYLSMRTGFPDNTERSALTYVVKLRTSYEGDERGLPTPQDRSRWDKLEQALAAMPDDPHESMCVLVSYQDQEKEWTYYARDGEGFKSHVSSIVSSDPSCQLVILVDRDPTWFYYTDLRDGVLSRDPQ